MKKRIRRGFTLVEVCIALVIMSLVAALSLAIVSLSVRGFNASRLSMDAAMKDADFASRVCQAVRTSGTAFTIPERSFTEDKLTAGWNYLGLMHGLPIPACVSVTHQAIDAADALVYIEYVGSEAPSALREGDSLIHNADGYFVLSILGHSYTDFAGQVHAYSLVFTPTDPFNRAAQTIAYDFSTTVTDEDSTRSGTAIATMMEALNAIQVVYQGSEDNPAVAIAFRSDFLPTVSATSLKNGKAKGTVILVLDVSGSMEGNRLSTLKSTARSFIEELSKNNELHILLTIFSDCADKTSNINARVCSSPCFSLANACYDKNALLKTIDGLTAAGSTNLGDGLRVVYHELQAHPEVKENPIFLLVLTDGEVNASTCLKNNSRSGYYSSYYNPYYSSYSYSEKDFYTGDLVFSRGFGTYGSVTCGDYISSNYEKYGRMYFQLFGREINEAYQPKTYLISMYKGMSAADLAALREVFDDTEVFDASSLTQFTEIFEQINVNISIAMWAFEGPNL